MSVEVALPITADLIEVRDVLDTERVCHVASGCFGAAAAQVPFSPLRAACGAEVEEWCRGAKCADCDTCREACGTCGLLVCPECREAMA